MVGAVGGWRVFRTMFEKMVIRFTDRHCSRCPVALLKMTAFGGPRTVRADEIRRAGEQSPSVSRPDSTFLFLVRTDRERESYPLSLKFRFR